MNKPGSKGKTSSKAPLTLAQRQARIRKRYDRPVLVYEEDEIKIPRYPTRFPKVTRMLGGGFPAGSITELAGVEDSGKSSLAIAWAADIQSRAPANKKHVILTNFERRFDKEKSWAWWRQLGLDTSKKNFSLFMPTSLETGIAHGVDLVESGEVCCWIIDSVKAGNSRESTEAVKSWADTKAKNAPIGVNAKKWGEALNAMVPLFSDTDTVCIAINQVRDLIELGGLVNTKGPKKTSTPGGRALKFFSWFRFEAYGSQLNPERWKDSGVDGRHIRLKLIKNGISEAPRSSVHIDLIRGEGFDQTGDLIDSALEAGAIVGKGNGNFEIRGTTIRGYEKLRTAVVEKEALRTWLTKEVETFLTNKGDGAGDGSDAPASNDGDEAAEVASDDDAGDSGE